MVCTKPKLHKDLLRWKYKEAFPFALLHGIQNHKHGIQLRNQVVYQQQSALWIDEFLTFAN